MNKFLNAHAELFFGPLDLSFCHSLFTIIVVIFSSSLIAGSEQPPTFG